MKPPTYDPERTDRRVERAREIKAAHLRGSRRGGGARANAEERALLRAYFDMHPETPEKDS